MFFDKIYLPIFLLISPRKVKVVDEIKSTIIKCIKALQIKNCVYKSLDLDD